MKVTEMLSDHSTPMLCDCCEEIEQEISGDENHSEHKANIGDCFELFDVPWTHEANSIQGMGHKQSSATHQERSEKRSSLCTGSPREEDISEVDGGYSGPKDKVVVSFENKLDKLYFASDHCPGSDRGAATYKSEREGKETPHWESGSQGICLSLGNNFPEINTGNFSGFSFENEGNPVHESQVEESVNSAAEALQMFANSQRKFEDKYEQREYGEDKDETEDEIHSSGSESSECDYPLSPVRSQFQSFQSYLGCPALRSCSTQIPEVCEHNCSNGYRMQLKLLEEQNRKRLMECRNEQITQFCDIDAENLGSDDMNCEVEKQANTRNDQEIKQLPEVAAAELHAEALRKVHRIKNNCESKELPHKSPTRARQVPEAWTQHHIDLPCLTQQYSFSITTTKDQTTVQADKSLSIEHITTVSETRGDTSKTVTTIQFLSQASRGQDQAVSSSTLANLSQAPHLVHNTDFATSMSGAQVLNEFNGPQMQPFASYCHPL